MAKFIKENQDKLWGSTHWDFCSAFLCVTLNFQMNKLAHSRYVHNNIGFYRTEYKKPSWAYYLSCSKMPQTFFELILPRLERLKIRQEYYCIFKSLIQNNVYNIKRLHSWLIKDDRKDLQKICKFISNTV